MTGLHDRPVDIAVVGAGAAGLAAAIFAAERRGSHRICLLDGVKTIGAKILVSGGGRCNVTHHEVKASDFFGNRRIIKNVLAAFTVEQTVRWFDSLGVQLKREPTGKLFPVTDRARSVLDCLTNRCRQMGVDTRTDHRVSSVERSTDHQAGFHIHHTRGFLRAHTVVLATGGRSLPKSGSDGAGYNFVRRLGHTITDTVPALVPLVLATGMFHRRLSGLSQEVELTTKADGRIVDRRVGSLLWTHFGISGPVVMDASRFWTYAKARDESVELSGNFLPGWTQDHARLWFADQAAHYPRRSLCHLLAQRVPDRLADALCLHAACDPHQAVAQVSRVDRERILAALTRFSFPIDRDRGWNYAEVTAGGVPLEEIDFRTMESKLIPGLYLIGELLDCDGRIGGFNFHWAWATGYLAGRAAASRSS